MLTCHPLLPLVSLLPASPPLKPSAHFIPSSTFSAESKNRSTKRPQISLSLSSDLLRSTASMSTTTTTTTSSPPPLASVSKIDENDNVHRSSKPSSVDEEASTKRLDCEESGEGGGNSRERLKRHRVEVAGRVWIPDIWGQEDLLKDWIDCSVFDASLAPKGIMSARKALVEEGRRAAISSSAAVEVNSC